MVIFNSYVSLPAGITKDDFPVCKLLVCPEGTDPITITTIWLFNVAMENHHAIKNGKPSTNLFLWAIYTMAMWVCLKIVYP